MGATPRRASRSSRWLGTSFGMGTDSFYALLQLLLQPLVLGVLHELLRRRSSDVEVRMAMLPSRVQRMVRWGAALLRSRSSTRLRITGGACWRLPLCCACSVDSSGACHLPTVITSTRGLRYGLGPNAGFDLGLAAFAAFFLSGMLIWRILALLTAVYTGMGTILYVGVQMLFSFLWRLEARKRGSGVDYYSF